MRTTINTKTLERNARKISSFVLSGIIALFLIASGCSSNTDNNTRVSKTSTKETVKKPPISVTSTPAKAIPAGNPTVTPFDVKETVLEVKEEPKIVTYAEAELAFLEKNYTEAVSRFTRYTASKSENPWGYYMLGLSAFRAGDLEVAKTAYENALALDQGHVKSWINLSRALIANGETSEAISALDSALALDTESTDAFRLKGRAYHNLNQNNDAIASYKQALVLDGEDAWSMNNLALIYIEEEQFDKALPALALAVETKDNVALFFNNLGMVMEHHGQIQAAVNAYEKAIEIDASNQKATDNLLRLQDVKERDDLPSIVLSEEADKFRNELDAWQQTEELVEEDMDEYGC